MAAPTIVNSTIAATSGVTCPTPTTGNEIVVFVFVKNSGTTPVAGVTDTWGTSYTLQSGPNSVRIDSVTYLWVFEYTGTVPVSSGSFRVSTTTGGPFLAICAAETTPGFLDSSTVTFGSATSIANITALENPQELMLCAVASPIVENPNSGYSVIQSTSIGSYVAQVITGNTGSNNGSTNIVPPTAQWVSVSLCLYSSTADAGSVTSRETSKTTGLANPVFDAGHVAASGHSMATGVVGFAQDLGHVYAAERSSGLIATAQVVKDSGPSVAAEMTSATQGAAIGVLLQETVTPPSAPSGGYKYLNTSKLEDYYNPALLADMSFLAIAQALDPFLQQAVASIEENQVFCNLTNQTSAALDFIALYHFNVDNYNASLPIGQKVALIQNVIVDKIDKGTPEGIYDVLNQVFGDAAVLIEWWQDLPPISPWQNQSTATPYSIGAHDTFRVQTTISDPAVLAQATQGVLNRKNVRSYFIGFDQFLVSTGNEYETGQMAYYQYAVISNAPWVVTV